MRYQIENGTVSLGGKTILNHIDFSIKGQEKIAVVGRNGAEKSTDCWEGTEQERQRFYV